MRALTIRQPWASLIALGVKAIETRSRPTKVTGRIAIHAGVWQPTIGVHDIGAGYSIARSRAASSPLLRGPALSHPYRLPLGAVVATANLIGCVPVDVVVDVIGDAAAGEFSLGDYTPGRFAWLLGDVEPIRQPRWGVRGALGWWDWTPDEVVAPC